MTSAFQLVARAEQLLLLFVPAGSYTKVRAASTSWQNYPKKLLSVSFFLRTKQIQVNDMRNDLLPLNTRV